jgi:antirestriction protein
MELPKSVRVGHRDFAIEDWQITDAVSEGRYGDCDKMNAKIRVCTSHDTARTVETLIHETLHACWEAGSLGSKETEEKAVTVLAKQLAQVLRDNPHLVQYVTLA